LFVDRFLDDLVRLSTQPPVDWVPVDASDYLQRHSRWHVAKKVLSRWLPLFVSSQTGRQVKTFKPGARVLWMHNGKPNFGDTLLELSGRRFLKDSGWQVDLWTLPHLADLLEHDEIFGQVFTTPAQIDFDAYDAVLLTELNHRSIREKVRYARKKPWASLFGYFWGPDRNQSLFSAAAVNQVFRLNLPSDQLIRQAGPVISLRSNDCNVVEATFPKTDMTLAVGGIDPKRTYLHWHTVLQELDQKLDRNNWSTRVGRPCEVTLVGSDNGLEQERQIELTAFKCLSVRSTVGHSTIMQTAVTIQQSSLFVGCDGGLLHLAHAVNVPSIALFADEKPELRLTTNCHSTPLRSGSEVSLLDPAVVSDLIIQAIDVVHQGSE
jgi:hypothetical protein